MEFLARRRGDSEPPSLGSGRLTHDRTSTCPRLPPIPEARCVTPQGGKSSSIFTAIRDPHYNSPRSRCVYPLENLSSTRGFFMLRQKSITHAEWVVLAPNCGHCGGSSTFYEAYMAPRVTCLTPDSRLHKGGLWSAAVKSQCCNLPIILWGNGMPPELRACGAARQMVIESLPPAFHRRWSVLTRQAFAEGKDFA